MVCAASTTGPTDVLRVLHDENKVKTVNHDKNITIGEYLFLYEYEAYQRHRIKS